jgi:hypothetical protein
MSAIVSSDDVIGAARALDEEACHLVEGHLYNDFGANTSRVQRFLSEHYPAAAEFLYIALAIIWWSPPSRPRKVALL